MITKDISERAEQATDRYRNLILGFRGAYDRAVNAREPYAPLVTKGLEDALFSLARNYLEAEERILVDQTMETARLALEKVGSDPESVPETLDEHLAATVGHARHEIATQAERDIMTVEKKFRTMLLRGSLMSTIRGGDRRANLIHLNARDPEKLKLMFTDRAGRRYPSEKFIRSTWRHHLLMTWNDVVIWEAAARGETLVRVDHPDPDHASRGMSVSIAGDGYFDGPVYDEIRDELFHPNSDAFLVRNVSQE